MLICLIEKVVIESPSHKHKNTTTVINIGISVCLFRTPRNKAIHKMGHINSWIKTPIDSKIFGASMDNTGTGVTT